VGRGMGGSGKGSLVLSSAGSFQGEAIRTGLMGEFTESASSGVRGVGL